MDECIYMKGIMKKNHELCFSQRNCSFWDDEMRDLMS